MSNVGISHYFGNPSPTRPDSVIILIQEGLGSLRIARTQDVYRGIASKNRSASARVLARTPRIPHDFLATVKGMNPAIDIRGF